MNQRRKSRAIAAIGAVSLAALGMGVAAAAPSSAAGTVKLVKVHAATAALRTQVNALGLDSTEHADFTGIDVILHGAADEATLRKAGFTWTVKDADLAATFRANAAKDRAYAARVASSDLPSGRTSYRVYEDYTRELGELAKKYPALVKPITLPNRTVEGRPVRGIEITQNAANVADGKPVFLMLGVHHAREWPSSENSMEFAYDLLKNWRSDPQLAQIMTKARTIVVPIVNVDGFIVSRNADPIGDFGRLDYEMKRKNCTISVSTPDAYLGGTCDDNPAGRLRGTDPNRNYPGFWGGPGASPTWSSDTYRGDAPGDVPEVDNIRKLVSSRQVTVLITNHTYSNLVLRPPSIAATGMAPDELQYKALGDSMAAHNAYSSGPSYGLYDTSGSTEDWSYWNTGGYGFTFEIGNEGFHPAFENAVVGEYLGRAPAAGAGLGGNRAAYIKAGLAAVDAGHHSTITGWAPKGNTLTISKQFVSQTSPVIATDGSVGTPLYYKDLLRSTLSSKGGKFAWAVNPSTRPLVVGRYGRDPLGPPQPGFDLTNPAGTPATGGSEFTDLAIGGMPQYDNGKAVFTFSWDDPSVDWDFYIYDAAGNQVASAATADDPETVAVLDPAAGPYRVEANNYDGGDRSDWSGAVSFLSPTPAYVSGITESWQLTCRSASGDLLGSRKVTVARGASLDVGNPCQGRGARKGG